MTKVWGSESCSGDKTGSGNWGWLDCGDNGDKALAGYITNGCPPDSIVLDSPTVTMTGSPGNNGSSNNVDAAMAGLVSHVVTLPVYSSVAANGKNATFTITGFLQLKVCAYQAKKSLEKDSGSPSCYDTTQPPAQGEFQVRYAGFLTPSQLATQATCAIGADGCSTILATGLVS